MLSERYLAMFCEVFSFPSGVNARTLNLIASIPGHSILAFHTFSQILFYSASHQCVVKCCDGDLCNGECGNGGTTLLSTSGKLSVCPSVRPSDSLSVLLVCASTCLLLCLSVCLSVVCLSVICVIVHMEKVATPN